MKKEDHIGKLVISAITAEQGVEAVYNWYGWEGTGASDAIRDTIKRIRTDDEEACNQIVVLGFSWGAVTVTSVVKSLSDSERYRFPLVYTIDPVPAFRAVATFSKKEQYDASDYAVQWVNWYQRTDFFTFPLGIGRGRPVAGANNYEVTADGFKAEKMNPLKGHAHIPFYGPMNTDLWVNVNVVARNVRQAHKAIGDT